MCVCVSVRKSQKEHEGMNEYQETICSVCQVAWDLGWPELSFPPSSELARVPPPSLLPPSRTKPLDLSLPLKKEKEKKVCNQYSDILITNRIRDVTKGFEQDN